MIPAVLADLVRSSAGDVLTRRGLDPAALPATVIIERPRNPAHGDYATSVALQVGAKAGVAPREFAGWLAEVLAALPGVRCAEVAGPGFLNLWLEAGAQVDIVRQVLAAGERFGMGEDGVGYQLAKLDEWTSYPRPRTSLVDEVQYAHARLASLARNAADFGITSEGAQLQLLQHDQEDELIRTLGEFPRVVALAGHQGEPRRVARYLHQVASASAMFTETCRVLPMGDEATGPQHAARLALCQATRQVLANGLGLLGKSAPERF